MRRNDGFTLIEVLVALTIGSLVVLMVHQGFAGATDLAARLDAERRPHTERMESRAFLARAFGSLEIGTRGTHGFEGLPDRVSFSADLGADGPTDLTVRVTARRLVVEQQGAAARTLDSADAIFFDYLLAYGSQSSWVLEWHSPASAPLAARMRLTRRDGTVDTLLLLIGPRG